MSRPKEMAFYHALSQAQIKAMKLVLITLPFILLSFMLTLNYTKRIVETPTQQLHAIQNGDLHEAYLLTSQSYQQKISFDQFKTFIAENPTLQTNEGMIVKNKTQHNALGTINGLIKADNGKTLEVEYSLIKEKAGWRINDMKIAA